MFRITALLLLSSTAVLAQYSAPIHDVDNPARQPWACGIANYTSAVTNRNQFSCPAVPAGKRLVIEFVSLRIELPAGVQIDGLSLIATTAGVSHAHYAILIASPANNQRYNVAQLTRIYADPGTTVSGLVEGTVSSDLVVLGTLSGYLVNLP